MSTEPIAEKSIPTFKKFLKQHVATIKAKGAEPIVVDTWARQNKPEDTKKLADAIITAANENDAIVLPVGLAFAESLKQRPDLLMHQKDKSHPTARRIGKRATNSSIAKPAALGITVTRA